MEGIDLSQLCGERITQLENGEVCRHGACERHIDSILRDGLRAGGLKGPEHRRDIHFGTRHPGEHMLSGMRLMPGPLSTLTLHSHRVKASSFIVAKTMSF